MIARKPVDERQHTGMAKFDGSTAHREHFKEMRLPPGSAWELGVQVMGGRFHHLIARGKRPPCEGKATFTTVVDMQESVEIVVVGRAPNVKSLHLGHFKYELPLATPPVDSRAPPRASAPYTPGSTSPPATAVTPLRPSSPTPHLRTLTAPRRACP